MLSYKRSNIALSKMEANSILARSPRGFRNLTGLFCENMIHVRLQLINAALV